MNPGKPLPELDDGVQAHLVHEERDNEFRVKSTGEMLGPDKCSGNDKGQVVVTPLVF